MVFDDEFNPQLNVTLYPGDAIFIPKGWYHQAKPSSTRLSMSIAMFDKSRITIDRDHLTLKPN
jgi:ribosomal protein L16 Arg81 hydroxylase